MALINYYNFRGTGGDLPLNGKTMTFTTTAATEPGDFLYYTSVTAETVTPFTSGNTTGLYFVGVAKTSAAANAIVTAYVHNDFVLQSWRTVWSGTWSGAVSQSGRIIFDASDVTLKSGVPLRITGSVTPTFGTSLSFSASEVGTNTEIYRQYGGDSSGGFTSEVYATFSGSTLSFTGQSAAGSACGSTIGSCSITITKIEQYY